MAQWYGSVVECLTRDRRAAGSSLTGVTAFVSLSKNINPSLVLVQPRKTRPFITERLLMVRKESNKRNKTNKRMYFCPRRLFLSKANSADPDEMKNQTNKTKGCISVPEDCLI